MKKSIFYLSIFTFFVSTTVFGQTKYYKTPDGNIIDATGYSKLKNDKLEKFKVLLPNTKLYEEFDVLYRNNDSIIYTYNWTFKTNENNQTNPKITGIHQYIGQVFPVETLTTIDNKSLLLKDLQGKPSLINFWFTSCKPCVEEISVLNMIKNTLNDSVNFIAISFEHKVVVEKFLKKHDFNFIHVVDAQDFIDKFKLTGFPKNVFLDKEGRLVSVENGIPYEFTNDGKMKMGDGKNFIKILRKLLK